MISFTVKSIPIAQPRQRHAIRGSGARQFISNYTPADHPVTAFKCDCRRAAMEVFSGPPIDYPIRINIECIFPRPSSRIFKKREMPREPKPGRPDWDNLAKSACDSLNGLLWVDDSLITHGTVIKRIAAGNEQPHVKIDISPDNEL